ncbi:MAG: CopD family protein [Deltaproteobacteria bacterium]|nr:CopD family protein [Deltaproteobacteria bacterium]MBP6832693.1 CopD family protein [Deltaproteobacteria bacterium]
MPALYLLSVWIHILAAMAWIGGMFFLVLVVVPWLRAGNRANAGAFLRETGQRFRSVGWSCFAILTVTGTFNLYARGVRLGDFVRPEWLASPFGRSVLYKLGLFALVLVVSAVHDFSVGPRASVAIQRDPGSPEAERLRRQASLMGRGNVLLALALVAVAVTLVRGSPW